MAGVVLGLLLAAFAWAADAAKPVALIAASYGKYEVDNFIKNALTVSEDIEYLYERRGESLPVADLARYSLVVVAHSTAAPLSVDDAAAVRAYLEEGGKLLLINTAAQSLARDLPADKVPWPGLLRVSWARQGAQCLPLLPEHPFLAGVLGKEDAPRWFNTSHVAEIDPRRMTNVIGTKDGRCLLGVAKVGKGWVAFLGPEAFRIKQQLADEMPAYYRMLRNIVADAAPLTEKAARAAAVRSAAEARVLVWQREWQRGEEYAPRFDPPTPRPQERITALSAEMAVDEFESLQINLTPTVDLGLVSWEIVAKELPPGSVRLFVQERPDPIPWPKDPSLAKEAPYWLMPPEHVTPKGRPEFTAPAGDTRILWLKIGSFGVKPGAYAVTLNLSFEKGEKVGIPVSVRVHPIQLPRRRAITLAPGGHVYGDVNNAPPALRFANNLESHGFEWSLLNAIRLNTLGIAGEGKGLTAAKLNRLKDRFDRGDPPLLDCSAWDDWMAQAISHGLTQFDVADPYAPINGELSRSALPEETREKVRLWFMAEVARYLREKGLRLFVVRHGDELSEKELRESYIPWARPLTAAGWGCGSSFTGAGHLKPDLNAELYPYVRLWTLNRALALEFADKVRKGELKVRPDAILGTYGAGEGRGSEHRKPLGASRFLGWESWMNGIRNCHVNPYFKGWIYYCKYENREIGIAGERWVSFINQKDLSVPLADCPFLEGIREGMEEGNLCEILAWYLNALDAAGGPAAEKARAARARLDKVLGSAPDSLVRWEEGPGLQQMRFRRFRATNEDFRRGKKETLDILDSLREEAIKSVKPSLYWNDVPLVRAGAPVAALYAGVVDAAPLGAKMRELGGVTIPVNANAQTLDPRAEVAILLGNGAQNPLSAALLKSAGLADADDAYPGKGSYFIREFDLKQPRPVKVLLIAGPDDDGTRKGAEMFARFLRGEGNWFVR
jgi:hypothetical protein